MGIRNTSAEGSSCGVDELGQWYKGYDGVMGTVEDCDDGAQCRHV